MLPLRAFPAVLVAAMLGTVIVAVATPAYGGHDDVSGAAQGAGWATTAIRAAALLATGIVAGTAVLRPLTDAPARTLSVVVSVAATSGVAGSLVVADRPLAALALALLTLAVPLSLQHPRRSFAVGLALCAVLAALTAEGRATQAVLAVGATVWLGTAAVLITTRSPTTARRTGPWAVAAAVAATVAGAIQAGSVRAPVAAAMAGLAVLALLMSSLGARQNGASRAWAVGVAGAIVAGGTLVTQPERVPVDAGTPLLRDVALGGERLPILVVPHRPGWNLVHTGDRPVSVGTDRDRLRPMARQAGATGTWRAVWLPPGPGRIWIRDADRVTSVPVDTGNGPAAPPEIRTDGPECASAVLGGLISGAGEPFGSCPAERLDRADADALRAVLGFLAGRGNRSIFLVGDSAPRSLAAQRLVREEGRRAGVTVSAEPSAARPIVVVSGWSTADATLRKVARGGLRGQGTYLAPWLLNPSSLGVPAGQVLPLRFSPRDPLPLRYAAELRRRFHGEVPTKAGYDTWLQAGGRPVVGPARLYAASLVNVMPPRANNPHPHGGTSWLPGGTITAVSAPLA